MGLLKEFRDFAMRGNVLDLAIGVIIGGAFGKIVTSLVNDVLMPPIGALTGGVDFSNKRIVIQNAVAELKDAAGTITQAAQPEVAIYYGKFINATIDFVIVAFCIFLVIKLFNEARRRFEQEKPAAAPAGPSAEVRLLGEIRDLLKGR